MVEEGKIEEQEWSNTAPLGSMVSSQKQAVRLCCLPKSVGKALIGLSGHLVTLLALCCSQDRALLVAICSQCRLHVEGQSHRGEADTALVAFNSNNVKHSKVRRTALTYLAP